MKGFDEGVVQWFGHVERNRFTKSVYVGECGGSRSVSRLWKRWIDTVKGCLKKRFGYQASKEEWSRIGVHSRRL